MNLNLQNLFSTTSQTSGGNALNGTPSLSGHGLGTAAAHLGDVMFGQLLSAQLQNGTTPTSLATSGANLSLSSQEMTQLKTTITQLLQAGGSAQQIANQLAQTLGSNFLAQLQLTGLNPGNMGNSLIQMLTQALGPPGNGPPQQVASALVQRFAQIANTLSKVANATGQQQDSLGTISDAIAGDTPAPNLAGILQTAIVALQQFANGGSPNVSSSGASPAAPPAPWTSTNSSNPEIGATQNALAAQIAQSQGNGPTVAVNPSLALSGTGADTVIGRILARAANVAANQAQSASSAQTAADATQSTTPLQPQLAVTAANSASNGATSDALAASLLRTVQTALASLSPPKSDSTNTVDASSAISGANQANSNVFASLGMTPVVNTTVGGNAAGPAVPQTAVPQAPVDPNAVVDQVLQGISMRTLTDGSQTVRMRLVPESLGSVTVNLSVQGGSVNATMVAQNTDVRDALLANQQALSRSLADAGLKLTSFTVNLANNGHFQQQQQAYQQARFGTTRRFLGITSSADESAVSSVVPTYGPPSTQLAALQWLNALA